MRSVSDAVLSETKSDAGPTSNTLDPGALSGSEADSQDSGSGAGAGSAGEWPSKEFTGFNEAPAADAFGRSGLKRFEERTGLEKFGRALVLFAVSSALNIALTTALKKLVGDGRNPYLVQQNLVAGDSHATTYGFPSGHTTRSTFFVNFLYYLVKEGAFFDAKKKIDRCCFSKRSGAFFLASTLTYATTVFVGISRIFAKAHLLGQVEFAWFFAFKLNEIVALAMTDVRYEREQNSDVRGVVDKQMHVMHLMTHGFMVLAVFSQNPLYVSWPLTGGLLLLDYGVKVYKGRHLREFDESWLKNLRASFGWPTAQTGPAQWQSLTAFTFFIGALGLKLYQAIVWPASMPWAGFGVLAGGRAQFANATAANFNPTFGVPANVTEAVNHWVTNSLYPVTGTSAAWWEKVGSDVACGGVAYCLPSAAMCFLAFAVVVGSVLAVIDAKRRDYLGCSVRGLWRWTTGQQTRRPSDDEADERLLNSEGEPGL